MDFGSTLPNKIDLKSQNLQPIIGDSFASMDGTFVIAFKYNGVSPIKFKFDNNKYKINYNYVDSSCNSIYKIYNSDTKLGVIKDNNSVIFRDGNFGYLEFKDCVDFENFDILEGNLLINYISSQTGSETPIFGNIRLRITN